MATIPTEERLAALKINPAVQMVPLRDGFHAVVNPLRSNSLELVSEPQAAVVRAIDGAKNTERIAADLAIPVDAVNALVTRLIAHDLVRRKGAFSAEESLQRTAASILSLWVHTADICNLRCTYCYIPTLGQKKVFRPDVWDALEEKLIQAAVEDGVKEIRLRLAGGEPFASFPQWQKPITRLVHRFSSMNTRIRLGCLTNGTLLNKEVRNFVLEHRVGLGISIDGLSEWNRNRVFISGKPAFMATMENLCRLQEQGLSFNHV